MCAGDGQGQRMKNDINKGVEVTVEKESNKLQQVVGFFCLFCFL